MAALSCLDVHALIRFKTIQRLKRLSNLTASVAGLIVFGGLLQSCESWQDRTGEQLFNDVVLTPMPESVRVLHSQDEPSWMDPWVWLHFEVTPESLAAIEAAYEWVPSGDFERDESDALAGEWWQVDQLEGGQGVRGFC